jgi:hypothetical protein
LTEKILLGARLKIPVWTDGNERAF